MQVTSEIILHRLMPVFNCDPRSADLCITALKLSLLSSRFLILHLWHPQEPGLEAFPRAAGPPLLGQP